MKYRPTSTCPRRVVAIAPLLLAASVLSGCSVSWDQSGIRDVLFGGRAPSEIVREGEAEGTTSNADAVARTEQGKAPAPRPGDTSSVDEDSSLRRIAILPVAWTDGTVGQPCDLCPATVAMKPTTALSARLVTGFIYEAIARHPRFLFPPPDVVEKAVAATSDRSFRQAAAQLQAAGRADFVVAAALIELRPRVGPDHRPEKPAGAALYAALINARTGETIWSDTFDQEESSRGMFLGTYDKVMNDRPVRWSTAQEYSEYAADELIEDLVDELD